MILLYKTYGVSGALMCEIKYFKKVVQRDETF